MVGCAASVGSTQTRPLYGAAVSLMTGSDKQAANRGLLSCMGVQSRESWPSNHAGGQFIPQQQRGLPIVASPLSIPISLWPGYGDPTPTILRT